MPDRETNLVNAFETTLAAEMSSVASSCTLSDATGLTAPFYLVIEPTDVGQREYVYVSALNGAICTVSERYLAGSAAASALTHPASSVVRMAPMSQHFIDINDRVDAAEASIAALGDHGGLTGLADDDHAQYLNVTRHDADDHSNLPDAAIPEGGVTQHEGAIDHGSIGGLAGDDHTQYYNAARHTKSLHDGLGLDHGALSGKSDDDHPQYLRHSQVQSIVEGTAQGPTSATTPQYGSPVCWKSFVAPPSGQVLILWGGFIIINTTTVNSRRAQLTWELRTGGTQGAGTVILDNTHLRGVALASQHDTASPRQEQLAAGSAYPVTGLTPGSTYHVSLTHSVNASGATIEVLNRYLSIQPI